MSHDSHPSDRAYAAGRSLYQRQPGLTRSQVVAAANAVGVEDTEAFVDGYFDGESPT